MSTLMRAPKECGSWYWDLEETVPAGLESALTVAASVAEVLKRYDLLDPVKIEYGWYVLGSGPTGVRSTLFTSLPLGDPSLPGKVLGSQPAAFSDSEVGDLRISGAGTWFDATGKGRREPGLIEFSVTPDPYGPTVTLEVHHDIWSPLDFAGRPHPDVHERNAPRLAAALREITTVFGVSPETGDPTYFGHAVEFGILTSEAQEDGLGINLTDRL
ncbi:hypothetical protein ACFXKR_32610 [Streptomyces violascens]|uniref:hypothetical protein n=1 Tax=Streptomyces violascens TaxID=67381 RepID=UPI0036939EA1